MSEPSKMPARIWAEDTRDYGAWFERKRDEYAVEYIRADIAEQMAEALRTARLALHEAEAILGGEYGDYHSVLCELMLSLDQRANAVLTPWEASHA